MGSMSSSYESEGENDVMYYSDNTNDDDIEEENVTFVQREKRITHGVIEVKKDAPNNKVVYWTIPNCLTLPRYGNIDAPFFTFLNVRWYLQIDCTGIKDFEYVALNLIMDNVGLAFNISCTFGVKKDEDSLVGTVDLKQMFCNSDLKLVAHRFFSRSALWSLNSEFVSSGKLTIMCNLKQLPYPTKLSELYILSEDIKNLFTDGEFCDVILRVKDREFKSHKIILSARSPVFASYFENETLKEENAVIDIPDCDPDSFSEFLEYLYSGKLENISFRNALSLYKTANKYDVPELKLFCVEHMEQNLNVEYFFDVLSLTELNDEKHLFNVAQEFFNRNLNKIFATSEWKNLMKNNSNLASKLLMEMSSDVKVVSKRRKLQ